MNQYDWALNAPTTPAYEAPTDLIARCLAGDESAYAALFQQYATPILRLNLSLLQHREDAEDVLQEAFDYAFRRLDRYDATKSSFKTWLFQIAISRCRNKRRRKWLPSVSLAQMVQQEEDIHDRDADAPDEMAALSDDQRAVWHALHALSPKLREVALLRYYEGLQYKEIGRILNIPTKTAESRMRLAHKRLRELLDGVV